MSKFTLSCTTCATRAPGKEEISECLVHAPRAGYKAWGIAGPLLWTRGLVRWANADLLRQRAAAAPRTLGNVAADAASADSLRIVMAFSHDRVNASMGARREEDASST